MAKLNVVLNWQRDPHHETKLPAHPELHLAAPVPTEMDCEPDSVPIQDQGGLGACTGFMGTGNIQHAMKQAGHDPGRLSEMLQYQLELIRDGHFGHDMGSTISTAFLVMELYGVAPAALWDYQMKRFRVRPPQSVVQAAAAHKLAKAQAVKVAQTLDAIKAINAGNRLVGFGFEVPTSFMDVKADGIWKGPQPGDKIEGGHAVNIAGYSDLMQAFKIRNSWSPKWGKNGYVWMPYSFVLSKQASDFAAMATPPA